MERALSKFGVLEIARTGKISLKRGSALLQMGGWGDSATRRAHQARHCLCNELYAKQWHGICIKENACSAAVPAIADAACIVGSQPPDAWNALPLRFYYGRHATAQACR